MASSRAPAEERGASGTASGDSAVSLRYKALSADSYHLDSPPFTGAAVTGHGPVTQGLAPAGIEAQDGAMSGALQMDAQTMSSDADVPRFLLDAQYMQRIREFDEELDEQQTPSPPDAKPLSFRHSISVPRQPQSLDSYSFPRHRLPAEMRDESKTPLVIVACGSFSPPTYLHLRMFEMAKDQIDEAGHYELLAGYYSPVSDQYKKAGLAKGTDRVRMCELAVERSSNWLMVDAWESLQKEYQRTAIVLDHFNDEINGRCGERGVLMRDGTRRRVKIMLLAGGDLIQSMGEPGVWADQDVRHILGRYGCLIVERTGADVWSFLLSHDVLWEQRRNLIVVKQTIYNDISSSKVRLFIRRGYSIKYLLPNSVIQYIEQNKLYLGDEAART
ncbi:nicotinamide-nucleotide adenylyltransferase [Malassezia vespertilionis]|uniref:Nicotinamide-nucleotide adenylyltransferase n=1 Tax=Malassezia vespertilionis TaxID=2020962 RepID=A0A2N1JBP7_9BASI|nr:nicotinamide-nucleotide adenylyltransferase [Malassezia vespertilionis]PKI83974.1 hypothetical protein MVES_002078 [Malassezia vespertilionis]WFD06847.1 nicotinamide-nucleotide adenylyltransferase [Malassezia vespertilionis]